MQCSRTRIAPTPSGYLHLGNILSFAITAAWAERTGASILLRIDDLDQERTTPEYLQDIFDTLHFMEIPWQEGPRNVKEFEAEWSQVHRIPLYKNMLSVLKEQGRLFACSCSRSQLSKYTDTGYPGACLQKNLPFNQEQVSWRLSTVEEHALFVLNTKGERASAVLPDVMQHFIVRKKDGYPAYQLTSLADDLHYGVDLLVRGADLWPSTLAQQYLATCLQQKSFLQNTFHHHALLTGPQGNKLSKSAGDTSVQYLRKQGYKAGDVYAMIAKQAGITDSVYDWRSLVRGYERFY